MIDGRSAQEISLLPQMHGMPVDSIERLMKRIAKNAGNPLPMPTGVHGNHRKKLLDHHYLWARLQLLGTRDETKGPQVSVKNIIRNLWIDFGIQVSRQSFTEFLHRHGYTFKRLTKVDRRAFTDNNLERTRQFLLRRLGLDVNEGVFIDEMLYKKEGVGSNYGWAYQSDRAIQAHIGRGDGEAVMFLMAMTSEEVLPITLPVPQPITVTAFLFEFWIRFAVVPLMLARGKRYIVMDNARVHRRIPLRILLWFSGIRLYFLPTYSPWLAPPEKIFLITHMKCNAAKQFIVGRFVRRVINVLHGITARECAGACRVCGWL
jgi:transposase